MEKIIETIPNSKIENYDLIKRYFGDRKVCMFDIETTGLSPLKSFTYLIGINIYENGEWKIIQLFNDDGRSEPEMIRTFHSMIEDMDVLYEFNGDTFDIPYIQKRMNIIERKYNITLTDNFDKVETFDMLKYIRPFKSSVGLPNLKQKTLEKYIGLNRVDMYNGGQLIDVYLAYLASGDDHQKQLVLRHNRDDMEGMVYISTLLAFDLLSKGDISISGINTVMKNNSETLRLEIHFQTEYSFARPVLAVKDMIDLDISGNEGVLSVPVSEGVLNYYYGTREGDGYSSVEGYFVSGPSFVPDKLPVYKEKAKDKNYYIILDDGFLGNEDFVKDYVQKTIYDVMRYKRRTKY